MPASRSRTTRVSRRPSSTTPAAWTPLRPTDKAGRATCVKAQAAWAIIRDIFTMLIGAVIALNEEFHSVQVHPELLTLAGLLLVGPAGGVAVKELFRGRGTRLPDGVTPESSPQSPSSQP